METKNLNESNIENNDNVNQEKKANENVGKSNIKNRKKRSCMWQHFTTKYVETENGLEEYAYAYCNFCDR